jgi:hypothetical protein
MPFDGRQPCAEVRVIDKALELLGPNGEGWIQHQVTDHLGNRCLLGAILVARNLLAIRTDSTIHLVAKTIAGDHFARIRMDQHSGLIESFNDGPWRTFDEIAGVLVCARNIAVSRC